MVNYFLNAFFSAFRKAAHNFPIKRTIPVRNWDGTSIQDHLTEADWKSIDREMTKQIENRNDRGVATVMCSLVEDRLKWLFERKCIDGLSKSEKNRIFTGAGPLSSFNSKIEVGFALGFFPKNMRDEMKLIGQIRNKLAHSALEIKFSDDLIQSKCLELKKFDGKIIGDSDDHLDEKDPMKIYTMSCFIVMTVLLMLGQ